MKSKIYLVKKVSKKEGKEPFTYLRLYTEFEYGQLVISMDKDVISQFLQCSIAELYSYEVDKPVHVANFDLVGKN